MKRTLLAILALAASHAGGQSGAVSLPPTLTFQSSPITELAPVLDRALAAYNAGDGRAFLAEFAASAPAIHAEGAYQRLFEGYYKGEFGLFQSKQLDSKESVPDRDRAALAYDAVFQKKPKAKIIANFIRENGVVKLMQIRVEKI